MSRECDGQGSQAKGGEPVSEALEQWLLSRAAVAGSEQRGQAKWHAGIVRHTGATLRCPVPAARPRDASSVDVGVISPTAGSTDDRVTRHPRRTTTTWRRKVTPPDGAPDLTSTDAVLVLAARAGDKGAFTTLILRHRPRLLAVCRRLLADAGLAEDAAQEAALQALLGLGNLRRPERFGSWLIGIGLHVCQECRRQRAHDPWSWDALLGGRQIAEPPDERRGPEQIAETRQLDDQVRQAVADLPSGQRRAVVLFYLAGLSQAEVAATLGIEVGAVKTRLHKARSSLRRQLWAVWKEQHMTDDVAVDMDMVTMRVTDVVRAPAEGDRPARHVVILEDVGGTGRLPIWVGPFEGAAIALLLERARVPLTRPLTFSFAASLLRAAGGQLREIRIDRLAAETFYATAAVAGSGGLVEIDARPSDALALALHEGAPIRVAAAVLAAVAAGPHRTPPEGTMGAAGIVDEVLANWQPPSPVA